MDNNSTNNSTDDVRLDKYVAAVWRAKWLILLIVIAATAATIYYIRRQPVMHTAAADIEIGRVWKEPLADTYVVEQTVNGTGFRHELAQKLGLRPGQLRQSVKAETVTAGPNRTRYPILLKITASTPDEAESLRLAQAAADELIARHEKLFEEALAPHKAREQRLEERLKEMRAQPGSGRELVMKNEDELDDVKFNNDSPIVTRKTALVGSVVTGAASQPSPWREAASAAVLAAIAAVAAVVLAAYLKPAIQSANRTPNA